MDELDEDELFTVCLDDDGHPGHARCATSQANI